MLSFKKNSLVLRFLRKIKKSIVFCFL
jgi:hypothetical protein